MQWAYYLYLKYLIVASVQSNIQYSSFKRVKEYANHKE